MDDVQINIDETVEEVLVASEEIIEQVNVNVNEDIDVLVTVSDSPAESVSVNVDEVVEEVLVQIDETPAATVTEYKIWTMPSQAGVSYTGFATDLIALTSEPKWAVKKLEINGTETWAGKVTYDQILDDYLTLTYS